jgi:S1-C subfamily serine protease
VQSAPESFASVARAAKPAVVNIFPTRIVRMRGAQDPFDEFFRQFFGEVPPPRQQQQQSFRPPDLSGQSRARRWPTAGAETA